MIDYTEDGLVIDWSDKSFYSPLTKHTSATNRETFDNIYTKLQKLEKLLADDKQAFDDLHTRLQQIEEITNRAIREGQRGHKSAIERIRVICQGIE